MRVITKKRLKEYWEEHEDARGSLEAWLDHVERVRWDDSQAVKNDYGSASILGDKRCVFNIKGNDYRLVVRINYYSQAIYIRFIGTHDEYDKIDATRC